jgi:hypothetical protein
MSLDVVTILGLLVVIVLAVVYFRFRSNDALEEMLKKRAATARLATTASFVEGAEQIPVALSLTDTSIFYENPDLEARIDLDRIEEVEYDDELSTAKDVKDGRVLRLRSHGNTYEFILEEKMAQRFSALLPPHRLGEADPIRAV